MSPDARDALPADGSPLAGVEERARAGDGRGREAVDLVAVDGGGSRCRLAAFGRDGTRLAESVIEGHASLTLGEAEAWTNVRLGIARLAEALDACGALDVRGARSDGGRDGRHDRARSAGGRNPVRSGASAGEAERWLPPRLALGLAGALQDERRTRFLARVDAATGGALESLLVGDGHAQLVGASGGEPGVCLAVGTGSVVHWLDRDGIVGMAGGWGVPIGDEGSGAWLGARLLQRHLWHRDGERCDSPLMGLLEARVGTTVSALQRWTTDARSTTHATLARLVVEQAERGDALALSLLDEGAERCLRLIELAPPALPVYVSGGLEAVYASRLAARLGARLRVPRGDALEGLRTIAAAARGR